MISELTRAKHIVELGHLEQILTELGYQTTLVESPEAAAVPVLTAALPLDERGRGRYLNILFVPVAETELETIELVQFHLQFPVRLTETRRRETEQVICALNNKIGLGGIGLDFEHHVFYRYVYPKAKYETFNNAALAETMLLFVYIFERVSGLVEEVAAGRQELADALKIVEEM